MKPLILFGSSPPGSSIWHFQSNFEPCFELGTAGEPGELGESVLVQLGTPKAIEVTIASVASVASNSSEKAGAESGSGRRRRSRRRRSRRRAGTYTGTIPYKVQVTQGLQLT